MSRPSNLNIYLYLRKSRSDIEAEKKAAELGETYDTLQRHRKRCSPSPKRNAIIFSLYMKKSCPVSPSRSALASKK
jgi:hypothetical protein